MCEFGDMTWLLSIFGSLRRQFVIFLIIFSYVQLTWITAMNQIISILLKRILLIRKGQIVFISSNLKRGFADDCGAALNKKGLVLGAYEGCNPGELKLTETAAQYDEEIGGKLCNLLKGTSMKTGDARVFKNIDKRFYAVAVAAVGKEGAGYDEAENLDMSKENIRIGAGRAARCLQEDGTGLICMEEFSSAEASSEAGHLATWKYDELKSKESQAPRIKLELYCGHNKDDWNIGKVKAEAQNLARQLEETPANLMNPMTFAQACIDTLCPCGMQIEVRDKDWIENKKMTGFLSVAQGSCENPLFLEVSYCGSSCDDKPITFCGAGVTFGSGGLFLKSSKYMSEHRGDLAGAAVLIGTIRAIAQLSLPVNVIGLMPLCENMPSGMAMRAGDVVRAMNGLSLRIENPDSEGVIMLADALLYALQGHLPCLLLSIGTFAMGTRKALGGGFTPVFSTSDVLWRELRRAGAETGDRFWRLPLWKYFLKQVTDHRGVDISNVGKERVGDTSIAAAFLKEFVPCVDLAHMDITGTGLTALDDYRPYLKEGLMTGRPTRTLIQFLYQISCSHEKGE